MAPLQVGLNIQKKVPAGPSKVNPLKKRAIFDDDDDDDDDEELEDNRESSKGTKDDAQEITTFDIDAPPSSTPKPVKPSSTTSIQPTRRLGTKDAPTLGQDLSTLRSIKQRQAEAETLDSSIYDYDAAYDALHAKSTAQKQAARAEALERKPKYMENLLAAAEVRKKDQLRAEDRLRQREREAEGEELKDTEQFVTEAYKKQQEELKRVEEEEKAREEKEAEKRRSAGMAGFYRKVMDEEEQRHAEAVEATKSITENSKTQPEVQPLEEENEEKLAAELAKNLNAKGAKVVMNEEGLVTDKRQLLTAGLNVAPKRKIDGSGSTASPVAQRPVQRQDHNSRAADDSKRAMRERQTRMVEAQLAAAAEKAAKEEAEEQEKMERAAKSRKTEGDVSSARERYLQRKKEAAAAAIAEKK